MARNAQIENWREFRRSAADMFDGFVSLVEPIEDMQPHRRAEHEQRRAEFVERQCLKMADAIVDFWGE